MVVLLDPIDQFIQIGSDLLSPPGGVQLEGMAAQAVGALRQVHFVTLIRQGQGRGHARDAASHHQGLVGDLHGWEYGSGCSSRALATAMLTRSMHFRVACSRLY